MHTVFSCTCLIVPLMAPPPHASSAQFTVAGSTL